MENSNLTSIDSAILDEDFERSFPPPGWITFNTPPCQEEAEFFDLESADGELDSSVEELVAKVDTSNLSPGRHTIFIESQDADGNFGVPSAVFIDVVDSPEDAVTDGTNSADTATEDADLPQVPFSNLVVFGDSLSDTGNVFNATEGSIPPSPPYADGRFSNGDLFVDALADYLELPENESFSMGGSNYAFGAAQTGEGTSEYGFLIPEPIDVPNIGEQIDLYLADRTPTDLVLTGNPEEFFFWDVFHPTATIASKEKTVAILNNVDANSLNADNFAFN